MPGPRPMTTKTSLWLRIVVQSYQVIMAWNWWQECAHELNIPRPRRTHILHIFSPVATETTHTHNINILAQTIYSHSQASIACYSGWFHRIFPFYASFFSRTFSTRINKIYPWSVLLLSTRNLWGMKWCRIVILRRDWQRHNFVLILQKCNFKSFQ